MMQNRSISHEASLIDAFKKMDIIGSKLLIVLKEGRFNGLVSAGDIQRAIIQNKSLDTKVEEILRKNIRIAKPNDSIETVRQMMFDFRMELCPVVDENNEIVKVYFWEEVFQAVRPQPKEHFSIPVVVMAGGLGTRLKPLTNVIPKPLIPIGDKTILEHIFERFEIHGCKKFYISVNYKAELIEYYLSNQSLNCELEYFKEVKPMGTAGSLSLLKGKLSGTFFISNCDILIEQDYSEILNYHKENKNEITIVAALKHYPIPYGTIETGDNGQLIELREKPELTFKINSGMYILESHLLDEIPDNEFFHITDLIEKVRARNGNVGVYPVSEGSWKDIGEWDEYLKNRKE